MSSALQNTAHSLRPIPPLRRVDLFLAGFTGRVGTSLRDHLAATRDHHRTELGLELRVTAVANRRVTHFNPDGVDLSDLNPSLNGESTCWPGILEWLERLRPASLVFVDCTASEEVASTYARLLELGIGVVTANKIAPSRPAPEWSHLRRLARLGDLPLESETTVGAALPILGTVEAIRDSGDRVSRISAVLSGTISFVLDQLHEGVAFSDAVAEAFRLGYTEPDPRIDLSGEDVARKLVILARRAGISLEREEISLEPLVSGGAGWDGDIERFVSILSRQDSRWRERVDAAKSGGNRLVYAASWSPAAAAVGAGAIPLD
ncbi:MAG: bifunctional aspartate kinase/homoserine dehydrogenase I, partial [Thermoanaerobaculia bacterium]